MALESFYGGKQGVSPVIKARFKYIDTSDLAYTSRKNQITNLTTEEAAWLNTALNSDSYIAGNSIEWTDILLKPFTMESCFEDFNYQDVWFEELCIIDTDSKTNPNNGKLFKRTISRNAQTHLHAEYIGKIVGPAGAVPNIEIGPLDEIRKKAAGKINNNNPENNDDYEDVSSWDYTYLNNGVITSENIIDNDDDRTDDYEKIQVLEANTSNGMLVPGKENNTFNDNIKYSWCNVKKYNANLEEELAWMYLGFKIPYPIFEITGEHIPYYSQADPFIYHQHGTNDNINHPFYHNLHFNIPRGARGIGPEEIYVVGKDGRTKPNPLYNLESIIYNQADDIYSLSNDKITYIDKNESWPNGGTDNNHPGYDKLTSDTYWVAKFTLYNPETGYDPSTGNNAPSSVNVYLGDYQDIANIELDTRRTIEENNQSVTNPNYGKLTIYYTTNEEVNFKIPLIQDINLDVNTESQNYGKLEIISNLEEDNNSVSLLETIIPLVKSIDYNDNTGQFDITYAGSNPIKLGQLNLIEKTWIDPRGHLLVLYKSPDYKAPDIENPTNSNSLYYEQTYHNSTWVKSKYKDEDGYRNFLKIDGNYTDWWQDLGSVVERNSVKIISEYIWDNAQNVPRIIERAEEALNRAYSTGAIIDSQGNSITGGLIFIRDIYVDENSEDAITGFFYYDYTEDPLNPGAKGWKYLGSWQEVSEEKAIIVKVHPVLLDKTQEIPWSTDVKPKIIFDNGMQTTFSTSILTNKPWE